ncbi:MAG: aminotransferase class I/II-fold pyridoxal phosphate-dependent enzyme [Verrucomicrobiae bacterium]|nr:aminotransferase class I/II-fold pyridoxal phosphate-dependent enzyme [Verrucomicrobiae bacterium]
MKPLKDSPGESAGILVVGRPNIGCRIYFNELVDGIFARRWFSNNGQLVKELEQRLCDYLGVKHCIPVCNATIGLQVVCHALGLKGEVLVPAFTFVATPHSVHWEGLEPVFVDIDPTTHLMDPEKAEALITPRTSAILGVHAWGRACEPERLQDLADRHGLELYFDAAHAFGCKHNRLMIGNFGRCEVFSFHATKFFNTFEGGAIATNDDELAARMRLMINFGFTGLDSVVHLGTNGKMSEIHAAMGLSCFEALDDIVATNRGHFNRYRARLSDLPGVSFRDYDDVQKTNYQYVTIEIDGETSGVTRDDVMHALHSRQIMVRRYFYPGCHRMEPYASLYPRLASQLPITDSVCERVLVLPTGTGISTEDVDRVCDAIEAALA